MRVGIITPQPPWYPGGVERHVGGIARGMKNEVDLEIFCSSHKPDDVKDTDWEGIPTHVHKGNGPGFYHSSSLERAMKNNNEFDIIHAHTFTTHIPTIASKTLPKKSFILTPHYHPFGSTKLYKVGRKIYDPIIGTRVLNRAGRIICVSNSERKQLIARYPKTEKKIDVIPNGVYLSEIKRAKPFADIKPSILYIGRLEGYKNIDMVIRSMKMLPEEYQFVIIGSGPEEKKLKLLSKELKLESRVLFLGNVIDSELYRWLKSCELFITLSEIEAFGITVIEALAAGKPVIVNDIMSLSEFAIEFPEAVSAIDVNKASNKQLTDLIEKILNRSSEVKDLKIDVGKYDWTNITDSILKLYNNV